MNDPFVIRLRELAAAIDATALEYRGIQPDGVVNKLTETAGRIERMADAIEPRRGPSALTPTQGKVLAFIRKHIDESGLAPTRQEIAVAFNCQPNNVQGHVDALDRKGLITRDPGVPRGIKLNKRGISP